MCWRSVGGVKGGEAGSAFAGLDSATQGLIFAG